MIPTHSYVGRRSCGCIVKVALDRGNPRALVPEVASWIRAGLEVERLPNEVVSEQITIWCFHAVEAGKREAVREYQERELVLEI